MMWVKVMSGRIWGDDRGFCEMALILALRGSLLIFSQVKMCSLFAMTWGGIVEEAHMLLYLLDVISLGRITWLQAMLM